MPLQVTALIVVGLKAFSAPQWLWGAAVMLILYLWWLWIDDIRKNEEKTVDIFKNFKEPEPNGIDNVQGKEIPKVPK
jgi:hypothetical protein